MGPFPDSGELLRPCQKGDKQENFCFLFEIKILKFRDFILFLLFLRDEVRALYNIPIITNNPVGED